MIATLAILLAISVVLNMVAVFVVKENRWLIGKLRQKVAALPAPPVLGQHAECGDFWGAWQDEKFSKPMNFILAMKEVPERQERKCRGCGERQTRIVR